MKILKLFAALLCISRLAFAQCDLVTNGSFEAGNTGFGTDLNFSPAFVVGTYNLVGNAQTAHPNLDNVSAQNGSLFMVVDGSTANPTSIWNQTVDVCEGNVYTFCFWYADIHDGYPGAPSFNVLINGVQLNATPIIANGNAWAQFCISWTATSATALIIINQNQFLANGDDFGIDNISFVGECSCEKPFCMYIEKLNDYDIGRHVVATPDGGFVAVGDIHEATADRDVYIVKYNPDMTVQFTRRIGDTGAAIYQESGMSVLPVEDGYFIAVTTQSATSNFDAAVIKLALDGSVLWTLRYTPQGTTNKDDFATKIVRYTVGGVYRYYLVGNTNSYRTSPTDFDIFMMGFSPTDGMPVCASTYYYGSAGTIERAMDAIIDNTNGFVVIAGEFTSVSGNRDMYALKINPQTMAVAGSLIVQGVGTEIANSVAQVANNNTDIYLAGMTSSSGNNQAIYLVKVNLTSFTVTGAGNTRVYTSFNPNIHEWANGISRTADNNLLVVGGDRNSNSLLMKVDQNLNIIFSKTSTETSNRDVFFSVSEETDGEIVQAGSYRVSTTDEEIYFSRATSDGVSCCNTDVSYQATAMLSQKTQHDLKNVCFVKNPWGLSNTYYDEFYLCPTGGLKTIDTQENTLVNGSKYSPSQLELSAVPNPSDGSFKLAANQDIDQIDVYDLSGKNVKSFRNLNKSDVNLNLSELENGVYILHVNSNNFSEKMRIVIHK